MNIPTKILYALFVLAGSIVAQAQPDSPVVRPGEYDSPVRAAQYDSRSAGRSTAEQPRAISRSDEKFLQKVAKINMAEAKSAKLLSEHAARADVKSFANKLVSDHQSMSSELSELAQRKNVSLPTEADRDHQEEYTDLMTTTGTQRDQDFIKYTINTHEKTIELLKEAAEDADDAEVRNFATKHLATFAAHHETARSLKKAIND